MNEAYLRVGALHSMDAPILKQEKKKELNLAT